MYMPMRAFGVRGLLLWIASAPLSLAAEFHVAPIGSDNHSGSQQQPWQTLQGAQANLRRWKANLPTPEAAIIWIHAGDYELTTEWHFTEEDAGTADAPITYAAYEQDEVRIVGGKQVHQFEAVTEEAILNRLPAEARANVRSLDLVAHGITDFGHRERNGYDVPLAPAPLELSVNGALMTPARWPNHGWATVSHADQRDGQWHLDATGSDRFSRWTTATDAWLHGFWENDWADTQERFQVTRAKDRESLIVAPNGLAMREGARFRVTNLLAELDSPGEWYLDRTTGKIYAWLPTDIHGKPATDAIVSLLETPVSLYEASHIRLKGLTIESSRVMGIEVAGGHDVVIDQCRIRCCGNVGVHIYHGKSHQVVNCEIAHVGHTGVRVEGGDRLTLTRANHQITRNRIHHFGLTTHSQTSAIDVSGVGMDISHNEIHDGPSSAITLCGNDHVVAYNVIYHVCQQTDDVGGIWLAHDPTYQGNVIRHNYLHDLGGFGQEGVIGIYLDDFASGTTVFGNVCRDTVRGIAIGGGRDNTIENNVIADCLAGIQIDSRGLTWAADWFDEDANAFAACLDSDDVDLELYESRYPNLAELLSDEPARAKYNTIRLNVIAGPHGLELHDGLTQNEVILEDNIKGNGHAELSETDGFVSVRFDSMVYARGFTAIPWDRIGPEGGTESD